MPFEAVKANCAGNRHVKIQARSILLVGTAFAAILGSAAAACAQRPAVRPRSASDEALRDRIDSNVQFVKKITGLSLEESEALREAAWEAISKGKSLVKEAPNGLTGVDLQKPEILWTFDERFALIVKRRIASAAWSALEAERNRLRARLKHAAVELLLSSLDELMLLSVEQRDEFRELLSEADIGSWRPSAAWHKLICADFAPWQSTMDRGALAVYSMPRSEVASILGPLRQDVCIQLRIHGLSLGNGIRQPIVYPRQERLIQLSLEHLADLCDVSDEQRAKLVLAMQLDLNRKRQKSSAPRGKPARSMPADAVLPAGLSPADARAYDKMRRRVLSAEQLRKLELATQERWRFRQGADLESIVAIFQRRAMLTSSQCAELFDFLCEELPFETGTSYDRLDTFTAVQKIPESRLAPIFDEFQRKFVSEQLIELGGAITNAQNSH